MTVPPGYRRVDLAPARAQEIFGVVQWAFVTDIADDEVAIAADTVAWDRARGVEAEAAGTLAGVHSSFGYTMRTPGGTVPASGLTWVSVHPAHRRRGILSSMIADHFARSRARGEAVSTLIAAETEIYQRFGYGLGHRAYRVTLPRGLKLAPVEGSDELAVRLEDASPERHADAVRAVLARDTRPGGMAHIDDVLAFDALHDAPSERRSNERLRLAIVEDAEGPAAFAVFRRTGAWEALAPKGTGRVFAWAAGTPAAQRRLFSVLADLDLMASLTVETVAVDDPLLLWAPDIRALDARLRDQLWVRILDIKAALEARSYSGDADVVIEVADEHVAENAHAWRLQVRGGVAAVSRAERDAQVDVRLGIRELSSAYLGGVTLREIGEAGLAHEARPGALDALSTAFAWTLAPRSTFFF